MINVEMTEEEAQLFVEFQKHHDTIGYLLGYMDSLKIIDLRNMNITMDIDSDGKIRHTSFTRHFRT